MADGGPVQVLRQPTTGGMSLFRNKNIASILDWFEIGNCETVPTSGHGAALAKLEAYPKTDDPEHRHK